MGSGGVIRTQEDGNGVAYSDNREGNGNDGFAPPSRNIAECKIAVLIFLLYEVETEPGGNKAYRPSKTICDPLDLLFPLLWHFAYQNIDGDMILLAAAYHCSKQCNP